MGSLDAISAIEDQKIKSDQYKEYLTRAISSGDVDACEQFVDHVLSESVPLVLSRQLLTSFAHYLPQLEPEAQKKVATHALEKAQPRAVSYEEQSTAIREHLAAVYASQEAWTNAARILTGIDLDSGMRVLDPEYKLSKNIKIAMYFLEDDDAVAAETYIKKASSLLSSCKDEELELQYKTCYARILDSRRRFLEAASRYYELSQSAQPIVSGKMIQEEDLMHALSAAITCTILAAAGPQRSRMLATLNKDERTAGLPVRPFLQKVYLERILRAEEVSAFAGTLAPHQLATLPDGSTVLERSVMEHNLEAASKLYSNIYINELAALLNVPVDHAEAAAARMIMEKRLSGVIDQVEGTITFTDAAHSLAQWDTNIQGLCYAADRAMELAKLKGHTM